MWLGPERSETMHLLLDTSTSVSAFYVLVCVVVLPIASTTTEDTLALFWPALLCVVSAKQLRFLRCGCYRRSGSLSGSAITREQTLVGILQHPTHWKVFLDYTRLLHCMENVLCYRWLLHFANHPTTAGLQVLKDTYLADGAPMQVNISADEQRRLLALCDVNDITNTTFDEIMRELQGLLFAPYENFKHHELFDRVRQDHRNHRDEKRYIQHVLDEHSVQLERVAGYTHHLRTPSSPIARATLSPMQRTVSALQLRDSHDGEGVPTPPRETDAFFPAPSAEQVYVV